MADQVIAVEESGAGRYCIGCGYNLRGLLSDRCPECGLPVDAANGSAIPWEGRKQLGLFRAFRRTCWEAMFHPRRLAGAVGFPVSPSSARGFRWIVTLLAALPLGILVTIISVLEGSSQFFGFLMWPGQSALPQSVSRVPTAGWEVAAVWLAGVVTWGIFPLGIFVTIYLWTGVLGFWVRPSDWPVERRDRATAVSAYACAPLALMFIPAIAQFVAYSLWDKDGEFYWRICLLCVGVEFASFLLIIPMYISSAVNMILATTHSGVRRWSAWIGLPICGVLAALIGLGLLPAALGLVRIMIQSIMSS